MESKLFKVSSLLVIISLLLGACGAPATTPIQPEPVSAPDVLAEATMEPFTLSSDGTLKSFDISKVSIEMHPAPSQPTMETILFPGDASELIRDLDRYLNGLANGGAKMASLSQQGSCSAASLTVASSVVTHAVDPFRRIDPNIKWGGSVFATLERLFPAMRDGTAKIQGFVISGDGKDIAMWFSWLDPVKNKVRNITVLFGEGWKQKEAIGTIFPMGEPAVIAEYGPMNSYLIHQFRKVVEWNSSGVINRDARLYLTREAYDLLGGVEAIGFGVYMFLEGSSLVDYFGKYLRYWAGCFEQALKENRRYKEWKQSQPKSEMALASNSTGEYVFMTEQEAVAAGQAVIAVGVVVVLIKIVVAGVSQQYWVVLVPVP